jgi:YtcA-like protein
MKAFCLKKFRTAARLCFATASLISLTGCRGAPSINLMGSFFPGWMLCIGLGVIGALLLRRVFVRIGMEPHLGPLPVVYFCLWLLISLASWLLFFRS